MIINVPTFSCISCENAYAGVGYFLIEIALVMFMMVLLAVLHINITNGNLNAYILYSQMVTLQFPTLGYTAWLPGVNLPYFIFIPLTVYSIWNLNFLTLFPPFCIPNIRTAVGVILLQYVIAACPLLFIIVSYTWIQCYNNGYRLVVYTTRPVHRLLARFWQKFKIQPSLIDTYAGLLLLAYMRLLAVSVKLLLFIRMDQMFSSFSPVFPVPLSYHSYTVSTGVCYSSNGSSFVVSLQDIPAMSDMLQVGQARSACSSRCLSGLLQEQCN